jgi:L-ascorbate metabolism protein UlaG (beta-lactamase superfamily)
MMITKFGHSCFLIEDQGIHILFDPGAWNSLPDTLPPIDVLLITHEHPDHLDLEKVKALISKGQNLRILTNGDVALKLGGIECEVLADQQVIQIKDVSIKSYVTRHASIYPTLPSVTNTGFLLNQKLFNPGDALIDPHSKVEILMLPVCEPWAKMEEVIDYVKQLQPKTVIPIHDGMLKIFGPFHMLPQLLLEKEQINFYPLEEKNTVEV